MAKAKRTDLIDYGGPAFPGPDAESALGIPYCGMMLRDFFAAAALAGLMADPESGGDPESYADCAYEHADAMLSARKAGAQ